MIRAVWTQYVDFGMGYEETSHGGGGGVGRGRWGRRGAVPVVGAAGRGACC